MPARKAGDVAAVYGRVFVITPTAKDCDEFLAAAQRSAKLHRRWGGPPSDNAAYARYLNRSKSDEFEPLLIRRRDDRALVGTVNLGEIIRFNLQSANVGYNAFEPFAGQGYMTEGVKAALRYAFNTLKLHRVEAGIEPENTRSIALVKRCGFEFEGLSRRLVKINGRWRDHERWAILKEDWQKQSKNRGRS